MFSSWDARYSPVRLVLSGIGWYLEQYEPKGFLYKLARRNDEFQSYRPVQYDIPSTLVPHKRDV